MIKKKYLGEENKFNWKESKNGNETKCARVDKIDKVNCVWNKKKNYAMESCLSFLPLPMCNVNCNNGLSTIGNPSGDSCSNATVE